MPPWTHFGHCWLVGRHTAVTADTIYTLIIRLDEQEEGWQTKQPAAEDRPFDGYQLRDLIVEKWTVPYDIQFKREVFMGKPMLFLNVMWKFEGQMSFPLTEQVPALLPPSRVDLYSFQIRPRTLSASMPARLGPSFFLISAPPTLRQKEYLEHLQAIAELLIRSPPAKTPIPLTLDPPAFLVRFPSHAHPTLANPHGPRGEGGEGVYGRDRRRGGEGGGRGVEISAAGMVSREEEGRGDA